MAKIFYKRNKKDEKIILIIFVIAFIINLLLSNGLVDSLFNGLAYAIVYAIFSFAFRNIKGIWNKGLDMPPKEIKDDKKELK